MAAATESPTEPLVQKIYYEDCPGCKQEKKKELQLGVPYREFLCISVVSICYIMPVSAINPYLYFMIRDLHIAKREEDIGFYAGFVGSAFMMGRLLSSVPWGIVADRYGRKPVVVISLISVVVFNTLFGLSTLYWMALTSRILLGMFSGLLSPIKACASEVCSKEHEALALSLVVTSLSIGSVVGSALGGFLAQPAENFPTIFSKDSFFGRFPYILPCSCISLLAVGALLMTYFYLPETLHMHHGTRMEGDNSNNMEGQSTVYDGGENTRKDGGETLESKRSLLKNWPLMSAMIVFGVFSVQEMAYSEIFSLWAVSSKNYGGLSFSSRQVGQVLAISGLALLTYQPVLYPCFLKHISPVTSIRAAAILSVPILTSYPFLSKLSGFSLSVVINCASFLMNLFTVIIMTGLNVLQNNAVSQHRRGAANGISVLTASFLKAIAPAAGGALFSWARRHQHSYFLPGDHMVFLALNAVALIGLALSFKPFLSLPSAKAAQDDA